MRKYVSDKEIWVSIDESTDVERRYTANVIIGTLRADHHGKPSLLPTETLKAQILQSKIAILFNNVIKLETLPCVSGYLL